MVQNYFVLRMIKRKQIHGTFEGGVVCCEMCNKVRYYTTAVVREISCSANVNIFGKDKNTLLFCMYVIEKDGLRRWSN
jgi:hypothetical protein